MTPPATVRGGNQPDRLCARFEGETGCIGDARDRAEGFLIRHVPQAPAQLCTNLLLVVSELVTNAVRYAPGPLVLRLEPVADGLDVSVEDGSPALPCGRAPDLHHGTGGFGWSIVQRLARRVYTVDRPRGKAVHAVMAW